MSQARQPAKRKAAAAPKEVSSETQSMGVEETPQEEQRGRMSTRVGNKNRHPGLVDRSSSIEGENAARPAKRRRTASEAALHRQQLDAVKQAKATEAKQIVQKKIEAADLEDRIAVEAEARKRHAARPPLSEIMSKVTRPTAELVADAQAAVHRVELAAGPLPVVGAKLQAASREMPAAEPYLDDFDDGDREDDEDYAPDPATPKKKKNSTLHEDISSDSDNGGPEAPLSPVRQGPKARKTAPNPRSEIRAVRAVPEAPADKTNIEKRFAGGFGGLDEGSFAASANSRGAVSNRLSTTTAATVSLSHRHQSGAASSAQLNGKEGPSQRGNHHDDDEPFSSKYGGLDDATEEREKAPERGQPKKGKAQSIATIVPNAPKVKLEPGPVRRRRRRQSAEDEKEGKKHVSHADLPNGALGKWQKLLMPAWKNYAASVDNVWDTSDDALCGELQILWDLVLPHIPWVVKTDGAVYLLAKQRWYDWRYTFASTAFDLVKKHIEGYSDNVEVRGVYASWLLDASQGTPFIWKDAVMEKNPQPLKGLFRSDLILKTLANHLFLVHGLPVELEVDDYPKSALALSVVAVERALEFWRTGRNTYDETNTKERGFSEQRCGAKTAEYMLSISGLTPRAWEKIQSEATAHMSKTPRLVSNDPVNASTYSHRAHFFEEDSD